VAAARVAAEAIRALVDADVTHGNVVEIATARATKNEGGR
jgi:hypothetical protein